MVPGPGSTVSARWVHPPVGQVAASWWPVPKALPQSIFSFFYFLFYIFAAGRRCLVVLFFSPEAAGAYPAPAIPVYTPPTPSEPQSELPGNTNVLDTRRDADRRQQTR
jgi:hypothetical protein